MHKIEKPGVRGGAAPLKSQQAPLYLLALLPLQLISAHHHYYLQLQQ
jgi:hypothetical protein